MKEIWSSFALLLAKYAIYSSQHGLLWTGKIRNEQLVGSVGSLWVSERRRSSLEGRLMYEEKKTRLFRNVVALAKAESLLTNVIEKLTVGTSCTLNP